MKDNLSLAALIAANTLFAAETKRRGKTHIPRALSQKELEDWREVVLAIRAIDYVQPAALKETGE